MNYDFLVTRLISFVMLIGLLMIFHQSIFYYARKLSWELKKRRGGRKSRMLLHLERVMSVVGKGANAKKNAVVFVMLSIGIFLLFAALLLNQGYGIKGILLSLLISLFPYGYLRSKLATTRITTSFEGEQLISEMVNQYKMHEKNIFATVDACILNLDQAPMSKKSLMKLSMRIKTYTREEELREILDDFIYVWNTVWAKMLADNIYNAVQEHTDIVNGLENILAECRGINKQIEKNKRDNLESFAIINFLGPISFIGFLWMAKNMMGYSWETIIHYEFFTPAGLMIFFLVILLVFINSVAVNVLSRQKYDI